MRSVLLVAISIAALKCGGSVCSSSTCTGCCLDGVCKVGSVREACGTGGAACAACTDFQTCGPLPGTPGSGSVCKQTCDDTTCTNGCCANGLCVSGSLA